MGYRRALNAGVLLCLYAAFFVVLTYPLVLHLGSCFIADQKDGCIFVWNIYNFAERVHASRNPFFTDSIFYPFGTGLLLHVYAPLYGLAGLIAGSCVLALNLTAWLSFVLSGLGGYYLCNHYVRHGLLSTLAGFAFAYCPYKLLHLRSHYDLILTATLPFFVLFFVKALDVTGGGGLPRLRSRAYLIAALACFAVTVFSCYYYVFFLVIFSVLYLAYFRFRLYDRRLPSRKAVWYVLIAIAASTALVNIFKLIGLDRDGIARNGLGGSSDVLAYLLPPAYSRFLCSDLVRHLRLDVIRTNTVESTVYVGYAILVFAVAYFVTGQARTECPRVKVISYLTGCFLVLSMPMVRIADKTICALPSALIHFIPVVNNFRAPYRYSIMVMLFLPILGGLFLKRAVMSRIPGMLRGLLVSGLAVILLLEYMQATYPMVCREDVPRVYDRLASMDGGALLEIPFGLRDGFHWRGDERTIQMYYQTIHHKPILAGLVSRRGERLFALFQRDPVVRSLLRMQEDAEWTAPLPGPDEVSGFLRTFKIKYILIHPDYRSGKIEHFLESAVFGRAAQNQELDGFRLVTLAGSSIPQGALPLEVE